MFNFWSEKGLKYILTYKFSQDHIEHFFGLIRSKLGGANNPTCVHFRGVYRKILAGITNIVVNHANVVIQDESQLVGVIPKCSAKMDVVDTKFELQDSVIYENLLDLSLFQANVVEYIAGYVVKKVSGKLDCKICIEMLTENSTKMSLISIRDFGGKLKYPSSYVTQILTTSEKIIRVELKQNHLSNAFSFDKIVLKILSDFVNLHKNTFSKLDEHCYELSKDIICIFLCIRLKYYAKQENREFRKNNLRSKLNRITIVQNN